MRRTVRIPMKEAPQNGDAIQVQVKGYVAAVHIDPLAPLAERVLVDLEIYDVGPPVGTQNPGALASPSSAQSSGSQQPFYPQQGVGPIGTCS